MVRDKNNLALQKWLADVLASDTYIKIGIIQDPQTPMAESADSKKKVRREGKFRFAKIDKTLVEIATIHEFGSPANNIPERSFLRSTWDENRGKILKFYTAIIKRQLKRGTDCEASVDTIQNVMGNHMVSLVKRKFTSNNWPRLKDPTRRGRNAEGLAKPLIDTGQLRNSVSYQIVEGSP